MSNVSSPVINKARDIWLSSDPHYDHANILKFTDDQGNLLRGGRFSSVTEMNEHMIERHNSVVKQGHIWYCFGDVTFKPNDFARIACRLNGAKRLIPGNHDDLKNYELTRWFEKIMIWRVFKDHGFIGTHIPITEEGFRYKTRANVHGHIHHNDSEPPWFNISMEKLVDFTPVHIDEIAAKIKHWPEPKTYKNKGTRR
jgi:calcineurin-like phosphoesterase family protein